MSNATIEYVHDGEIELIHFDKTPFVVIRGDAARAIIDAANIHGEHPEKYAEAFILRADGSGLLRKGVITIEDEEGWV